MECFCNIWNCWHLRLSFHQKIMRQEFCPYGICAPMCMPSLLVRSSVFNSRAVTLVSIIGVTRTRTTHSHWSRGKVSQSRLSTAKRAPRTKCSCLTASITCDRKSCKLGSWRKTFEWRCWNYDCRFGGAESERWSGHLRKLECSWTHSYFQSPWILQLEALFEDVKRFAPGNAYEVIGQANFMNWNHFLPSSGRDSTQLSGNRPCTILLHLLPSTTREVRSWFCKAVMAMRHAWLCWALSEKVLVDKTLYLPNLCLPNLCLPNLYWHVTWFDVAFSSFRSSLEYANKQEEPG